MRNCSSKVDFLVKFYMGKLECTPVERLLEGYIWMYTGPETPQLPNLETRHAPTPTGYIFANGV